MVFVVYAASGFALLAYPWDWAPDEGLYLDAARRLLTAPGSLYAREVVPFPDFYGPTLPLLLAPIVALAPRPLVAARVLSLAAAFLATLAVFRLVRSRSGSALALVSAVAILAPGSLSVWLALVRTDAPTLALWLWSGVALLPARLEQASDRLTPARLWSGSALLVAACFCRPTSVLLGAPLVLGWALVDRRSFTRLALAVCGTGCLIAGALQLTSGGGYAWVLSLWTTHGHRPGQVAGILAAFARLSAPVLLAAAAGTLVAFRGRPGAWRDPAFLLVLGAAALLPTMGKGGAATNYCIPILAAAAVLGGRLWSDAPRLGQLVLSAAVLGQLWLHPMRLPSRQDRLTSQAFYDYVAAASRAERRPILALTPDYAYFLVGQPVEIHGSGLGYLAAARVRGIEKLQERLDQAAYGLLVVVPHYLPEGPMRDAVLRNYRQVGDCRLGYYYGNAIPYLLFRRADAGEPGFTPAPEARCFAVGKAPAPAKT